jgi:hypothetical protein
MTTRNRDKSVNQHRQAMAGIRKHFASAPTLMLGGTPTSPNDAIATLQGTIDAIDKATAAEQAMHEAVTAKNAAMAKSSAALGDLKTLVKAQLGSSASVFADFGFQAPSRQAPTEATKAAAVAKRAATRKVRQTLGKRQKAKLTGTVPAGDVKQVAVGGTSGSSGNATSTTPPRS